MTSANCLRELTAASELRKPLIVVYEPEEGHGGGTTNELLHLCPSTALRAYLEEQSFIRWSFKPDQQLITLTLVCTHAPASRRARAHETWPEPIWHASWRLRPRSPMQRVPIA